MLRQQPDNEYYIKTLYLPTPLHKIILNLSLRCNHFPSLHNFECPLKTYPSNKMLLLGTHVAENVTVCDPVRFLQRPVWSQYAPFLESLGGRVGYPLAQTFLSQGTIE